LHQYLSIRYLRYLCFDIRKMITNNYLFVYGTLLDDGNEFAIYLKNNCSYYAEGRFKGRLYDIGEYPGAVADSDSAGYIYGSIYVMNNATEALKLLDDYEGFGDEQEQPNLFVRRIIEVETGNELVKCEVYLYNLNVDGLREIEDGNYRKK
jgi:gamma-glutamylcyclotransferase (GGCT)/AIG2-like uncharacterized protein YtfP